MSEHRAVPLLGSLAALLWAASAGLALAVLDALPDPGASLPTTAPALLAWDEMIAGDVHAAVHGQPWVPWVAGFFAVMGSGFVLAPLTVVVVAGLTRREHRWWALWVGVCGMGGWLISQGVKHLVDRQRPVWPDPFEALTSPSFPSGHSMAGVYGYVVFGIVALGLLRQRWPGVCLIGFGLLMGPSRVLLGVHWPTDVLMGWLLAGAWVCTCAAAVLWWRGRRTRAHP